MKQNKGIIGLGLIIAIVLGIAVVSGGAYYLGKNKGENKEIISPENILPNDESQNITTNNITVPNNWKTYTNTEYGFEFKYPNDWVFSTFPNPDGFFFNDKLQNKFTFAILPRGGFDHGYEEEPIQSDFQINGKQGKISKWNNSIWFYQFIDNTIPSNWIKCGADLKSCNRIEIQGSDKLGQELIDQILSTFKFTN